ncbi:MAG: Rne/Rng family ribonuclease, partial [Acidobacteriota bacterium]
MREDEAGEPDEELAAEVDELIQEAVADAGAETALVEAEPRAELPAEPQGEVHPEVVAPEAEVEPAALPHAEAPVAPVVEPQAALPADHPFAGLGAVAALPDAPSEVQESAEAQETTPQAHTEEPLPEVHTEAEASATEDGPSTEDDDEPQDSGEAEGEGDEEPAAVDHEGPEPARIPTSLTAALREQGHRYPHRVSRRMRRKMRGGAEERGEKQTAAPAEPSAGEIRPVETRAESRPENRPPAREERRPDPRERGGNRERSRGDRPERGERTERGERPERGERTERPERAERPERERPALPSISDLLKEGQEIIVQIAKEPLGQKGARITSHIALPGRFVVYMPTVDHAGVSRKIPSEEERHRLKRVVQTHRQGIPGGFICRTAAEGKSEEELKSDMHFLYNLWLDMRQKAEKRPAPVLLHHDLDLVQRILRDQLTASFKTIWVDNEELYESILRFAQRFQPALVGRVKLYTRVNPIFDEFGITNELEKALRPKVWLKSGGYIVINQTEALVAIDINTGKYVGKSNRLEDTIVKINTDAIREIVRQIRLRDLGGIIVVDFIDMDERKNRQKVMQ